MAIRYIKGKKRDYKKEAAYEDRPEQVRRRVARNKARRRAEKKGLVRKGDNKEVDHVGSHRTGSLEGVPTRVVPRSVNRRKQPDRPGGPRSKERTLKKRKKR